MDGEPDESYLVGTTSIANYRSLVSSTRFFQFLFVGGVGAAIDNVLLVGLVEVAALAPSIAAIGAKEVSILFMFGINERWTFADHRGEGTLQWLQRLVKSNVVRSGGAIVGIVILYALHRWFGIWYLLANIVGIGIGFLFNYTFESLVTWRVQDTD